MPVKKDKLESRSADIKKEPDKKCPAPKKYLFFSSNRFKSEGYQPFITIVNGASKVS